MNTAAGGLERGISIGGKTGIAGRMLGKTGLKMVWFEVREHLDGGRLIPLQDIPIILREASKLGNEAPYARFISYLD